MKLLNVIRHEIESGENLWPAWAEKLHDGGIMLTDHRGIQAASDLGEGQK